MNDKTNYGVSAAGLWVNPPVSGPWVNPRVFGVPAHLRAAEAAAAHAAKVVVAITPMRVRPTAAATAMSVDRGLR